MDSATASGKGIGWKRRSRRFLSRRLRPIEAWGRRHLLLAADRIALLSPAKPNGERVLLVRLDNIGDFIVWLDAATAIVSHFRAQGKRVTLLANAVWAKWAGELGVFDEVIAVEEKRFRRDLRYRLRMARQLRARGFGVAVQPAYTRILEGGDAVVRLSGAGDRIGPVGAFDSGAEGNRRRADRWYTQLLPMETACESEMGRNAAFVRALTGSDYRSKVADLREHAERPLPEELLDELAGKSYFVLFPGASFAGRLWPAERYVEIAARLQQATGWVGVICGGPGEAAQAKWIGEQAVTPPLNWVGRTSLSGLATVLRHAELLVGNETSAVHLAAAVGTPAVCITGGGHFGRFVPYSVEQPDERPLPAAAVHRMSCFHCDWRCVYHPPKGSPVPCIEEVSVAEAWDVVERLLPSMRLIDRAFSPLPSPIAEPGPSAQAGMERPFGAEAAALLHHTHQRDAAEKADSLPLGCAQGK